MAEPDDDTEDTEEEDESPPPRRRPKRKRGRTASEVRELKLKLRLLMEQGLTDLEIMGELDVPAHDLKWLREQLLKDELLEVRDETPAETWLKYRIGQQGVIRDLDVFIELGKRPKANAGERAAGVTALKIKSGIIDSIIEKGQQFGVLYREGAKESPGGSHNGRPISEYDISDLEEEVLERHLQLKGRLEKYGVKDFAEEDDGDIYENEDEEGETIPTRSRVS